MTEESKKTTDKIAVPANEEELKSSLNGHKSMFKSIPYISATLNVIATAFYLYLYFMKSERLVGANKIAPYFICFVFVQVFISISIVTGLIGNINDDLRAYFVEWCLAATIYLTFTATFMAFYFH